MPTFDLAKLEAELTLDEGVRFTVYTDTTGNPTVGIGHNLNAGPLPGQSYPMTQAQVDALFAKDVASTVAKLDAKLPWWRSLDDVRQRVLINMTFNLGIGGLMTFVDFLSMVQHGHYADAATDMSHTLWARQVGNRAVRLEAMMRNGTPAIADPFPAPIPVTPAQPVPPPIPAPQPKGLFPMNLSLLTLIISHLNLLSFLQQDVTQETAILSSSADGKTKLLQTLTVLKNLIAQVEASMAGQPIPPAQ